MNMYMYMYVFKPNQKKKGGTREKIVEVKVNLVLRNSEQGRGGRRRKGRRKRRRGRGGKEEDKVYADLSIMLIYNERGMTNEQ